MQSKVDATGVRSPKAKVRLSDKKSQVLKVYRTTSKKRFQKILLSKQRKSHKSGLDGKFGHDFDEDAGFHPNHDLGHDIAWDFYEAKLNTKSDAFPSISTYLELSSAASGIW